VRKGEAVDLIRWVEVDVAQQPGAWECGLLAFESVRVTLKEASRDISGNIQAVG